jgi:hypothetical protein
MSERVQTGDVQTGDLQAGERPTLSVVVVIVSDTTDARSDAGHLTGCLEALARQVGVPPMEIIVPYHPRVDGIDAARARFPEVEFIPVGDLRTYTGQGGSREHHDELRARGLAVARGEVVALLEDHARADPRWCARMVEAHRRQPAAAVGGAIENGIDRALNWAVYFCDFGRYQNPVPDGASPFASDANVSYRRSALEAIRPVWREIFHETAVNSALTARGDALALSPEIVVYQHRSGLRLGSALRERFIWGRSYAATRGRLAGRAKRAVYATLSPALPAVLLARMAANVARKGRLGGAFVRALPLTAMLTVSWSLGELVGYVTARAGGPGGERRRCPTSGP